MSKPDPISIDEGENSVPVIGSNPLAEVLAAHGGKAFLSIRSLTMSGTGQFYTPPQIGHLKVPLDSFTLYSVAGGRSRLEATSVFGRLVFLIRGEAKGGLVVMAGRTQELPEAHMSDLEPLAFLRAACTGDYVVTATPDAEHFCEVQSTSGQVTYVFIDPETKLMHKLISKRSRGDMTVLLSEYRSVEDVQLPRHLRLLENGEEVFHLFGQEITLNTVLDDKLFEMP